MWVWQSQAPAGISKLTGVAGCAAFAQTLRFCMIAPAAMEPSRILRRVSIGFLPDFFFGAFQAAPWPKDSRLFVPCTPRRGTPCDEKIRSDGMMANYCPDGVRNPCQASRTWW